MRIIWRCKCGYQEAISYPDLTTAQAEADLYNRQQLDRIPELRHEHEITIEIINKPVK